MDVDIDDNGVNGGPSVSAHRTSPDRTVLTEEGNSDGWIASDIVTSSAP
jgi:hypothetical protein